MVEHKERKEEAKRYRPEEIHRMGSETDLKRLDSLGDEEIDYSDIPDSGNDNDFWRDAKRVRLEDLMPKAKRQVTLRLDQEVLEWFKSKGPGYQTRMNAVLKAYKEHHG
jgi:uncharacterized protein (DUF4415 family)